MEVLTEKEAEKFLKKEGFLIVEGFFVKNKSDLKNKNFKFSYVAKASGEKIVHKKELGGIVLGVNSLKKAETSFDKLKRIKGVEEVFFQRQLVSKEFLLGIKKTPEFGHVIVYGVGGSGVEQKKDFSFRVCPLELRDIREMIEETSIGKNASADEKVLLQKEILRLCALADKFPKIKELDINPLMVSGGVGVKGGGVGVKNGCGDGVGYVVDARIVFE